MTCELKDQFSFIIMFSFGNQQKKEEEEKPQFQISENMLISELPDDIKKDFISVYQTIQDHKAPAAQSTTYSTKNIEENIDKIKKDTLQELQTNLTSVAGNIDRGNSILKELENELKISKLDITNSSHIGNPPTHFIRRYVNKINKMAYDLEQKLAMAGSCLQPQQNNFSEKLPEQIMIELLEQQQNAITRCAARVAQVQEKTSMVRAELESKLNLSALQIDLDNDKDISSIQQNVLLKLKQFQIDEKKKISKRNEELDLLGNSTKPVQTTQSGFSGFSFGGFGKKS